jgi:hypothetical protein
VPESDDSAQAASSEPVGLAEDAVRLDPFTPREAFARGLGGAGIRTWFDRCRVMPLEPIDTGVDRRMDLESIAKQSTWVGKVKPPREKTREEYPLQLEEQMREVERQFILRNIGRYEMFVDPDEPLPLEKDKVERPSITTALAGAREYDHKPPEMLDAISLDAVRAELAWRRRFTRELVWNRRFGAEVRKHVTVPLWKFDPEDPESADVVAAIEAEILGRVSGGEPDEGGDGGGAAR